jgi:hypothetical protein
VAHAVVEARERDAVLDGLVLGRLVGQEVAGGAAEADEVAAPTRWSPAGSGAAGAAAEQRPARSVFRLGSVSGPGVVELGDQPRALTRCPRSASDGPGGGSWTPGNASRWQRAQPSLPTRSRPRIPAAARSRGRWRNFHGGIGSREKVFPSQVSWTRFARDVIADPVEARLDLDRPVTARPSISIAASPPNVIGVRVLDQDEAGPDDLERSGRDRGWGWSRRA